MGWGSGIREKLYPGNRIRKTGSGTQAPSPTDLLMFLGSLEPPERVGGVPVPVEELDGLARVVQHVFRWQALRLRDIPAAGQCLEILFYTHIGCFSEPSGCSNQTANFLFMKVIF
jgi:hypothetical protein